MWASFLSVFIYMENIICAYAYGPFLQPVQIPELYNHTNLHIDYMQGCGGCTQEMALLVFSDAVWGLFSFSPLHPALGRHVSATPS